MQYFKFALVCFLSINVSTNTPFVGSFSPYPIKAEYLAPVSMVPISLNLTPKGAVKKYVYAFWEGKAEGTKDQKKLLGGKGANMHHMSDLGLPVPPGFTISTEAAIDYFNDELGEKKNYPPGLEEEIQAYIDGLERVRGKKLGDPTDPLLVAVRSGAAVSMPGMMDTILNVGLNDQSVISFANKIDSERTAWDSYRRLIQMFGKTVFGIGGERFEHVITLKRKEKSARIDTELTAEDWQEIVTEFKEIVRSETGREFPQDPKEQLELAIKAVFDSAFSDTAISYRKEEGIPDDIVSAVNVMSMVFGNTGEGSGTGVMFTRDPNTGENVPFGDYLENAQGEDVVAGIRSTVKIQELAKIMPHAWYELMRIIKILEREYKEMQDTEFTIEKGTVYMLQTRSGKRAGLAAFKIASDLVEAGTIDKEEAVMRISDRHVQQMLYPQFLAEDKDSALHERRLLTIGEGAVPAAASGAIALTPEQAVDMVNALRAEGSPAQVLLVRHETSPEDVDGMRVVSGILTATGGLASHAAVVARGWGKCCIVGAKEVQIEKDSDNNPIAAVINGQRLVAGDIISLDGNTGEVILESIKTEASPIVTGLLTDEDIEEIADGESRKLEIQQGRLASLIKWIGPRWVGKIVDSLQSAKNEELQHQRAELKTIKVREHTEKRAKARETEKFILFQKVMGWARDIQREGVTISGKKRVLQVRANADEPQDVRLARSFGAEGIGLTRSEHQFFDVIRDFRAMILAQTDQEKERALKKIRVHQEKMNYENLKVMDGYESIIRLLDPPLHEFLPHESDTEKIKEIAEDLDISSDELKTRIRAMQEVNPMMAKRGVRLHIVFPEIPRVQMEAIISAEIRLLKEGYQPVAAIEVPLAGFREEVEAMREIYDEVKSRLFKEAGFDESKKKYVLFGTMGEIPRLSLVIDTVAELIDFISFGTNDLTQFTLGVSRDDAPKFSREYLDRGIWKVDPFNKLDQEGVGKTVRQTVLDLRVAGKRLNKHIDVGVCGEQAGDPESVHFFFDAGLDNISASTMRVPVAILATAQKTILERQKIREGKVENPILSITNSKGDRIDINPDDPLYQLLVARFTLQDVDSAI